MTVQSATKFDVEEFARAYTQWDIDALLALYADDMELVQVDRDHPPSIPRVLHGKEVLRGMLEHCSEDVTFQIAGRSPLAGKYTRTTVGAGLVEKLDYLHDLGVTAISLLSFYQSSRAADGFRIAAYESVAPRFGTLRQSRSRTGH